MMLASLQMTFLALIACVSAVLVGMLRCELGIRDSGPVFICQAPKQRCAAVHVVGLLLNKGCLQKPTRKVSLAFQSPRICKGISVWGLRDKGMAKTAD